MTPHDARVGYAVIERLHEAPELANAAIDVHVDHGLVTLSGTVEDHHAGWVAREIARSTLGAVDARAILEVRPDWGEERAALATEFDTDGDAEAMSSPRFRLIDSF